jgi:chromosome segregation ATPase
MQDMERRMKKINELEKLLSTKNAEVVAANRYVEQVNVAALNKDKLVAELTSKVDELRQELNNVHLAENYDESVEKMKLLVAELDENYRVKNKNYAELEENYVQKVNELEQINVQIEQVKSCILAGQNEAAWLECERERLREAVEDLNSELEALKNFHHEAVLRENSNGSEGG